jgi:hypothetical protein
VVCGYGFEDELDEFFSSAGEEMFLKIIFKNNAGDHP